MVLDGWRYLIDTGPHCKIPWFGVVGLHGAYNSNDKPQPSDGRLGDNVYSVTHRSWELAMHTHLKGRIFTAEGTSYLVLPDDSRDAEWLRVKTLDGRRTVRQMKIEEIVRYVTPQQPVKN